MLDFQGCNLCLAPMQEYVFYIHIYIEMKIYIDIGVQDPNLGSTFCLLKISSCVQPCLENMLALATTLAPLILFDLLLC